MRKSLVLVLLTVFAVLTMSVAASAADVAVLISDATRTWYEEVSWDFEGDMNAIRDILELGEISYVEISDEDLAKGNFGGAKTVILPNNRRMSVEQADATRQFLADGGTAFMVMQASFKDENNENVNGKPFHLGEEMGIAYEGFGWKPPAHGYIKPVKDHPIFEGLPEFIKFHRNWAMIVDPADDAKVLAEWYNDDKMMPSHLPEINAAIVENKEGNIVYVGEMIFMPKAMESAELRTLATNIVNYLINQSTK